MIHLVAQSDIARAYGVTLGAVTRWREADTFPRPVATYGASRRPLFDPADVAAWVASHRPEYAAAAVGVVA